MRSFVLPLLIVSAAALDASKFLNVPLEAPVHNAEMARYINSLQTTWRATEDAFPWFQNLTVADAKKRMGALAGGRKAAPKVFLNQVQAPESFDARDKWDDCPTIKVMRDQSSCGSCWAFGAVEAMSDRICIHLGQKDAKYKNVSISAADLVSCCTSCGNGCFGGFPIAAWDFWKETGLVTEDCQPYPFPHCEHHMPKKNYPVCQKDLFPTPACWKNCTDGSPASKAPRFFGTEAYSLSGEDQFIQELTTNGPFEVTLSVYSDFEAYKTGIYQHVTGDFLGGHAVKLIGYGVENGVKYWRIANSWNADWGEGGTFRIVRGTNECGIEDGGSASLPATP